VNIAPQASIKLPRLSNLPIGKIATGAGFRSGDYMVSVFKIHLATTPSAATATTPTAKCPLLPIDP